jgi:two-component system NtrC family sensor kinase
MLQKKLLQTAKLASIGELAAGVAHEINNPLGFVTSNCNTLSEYFDSSMKYWSTLEQLSKESPASLPEKVTTLREQFEIDFIEEDGKSLLKETLEGLERVSNIVVDLKSFARVDKQESEKAGINKLIEDALNLVRNETKYKLQIATDLPELPDIDCYPSQLVQVFTNLFINASHATDEKGTLNISTANRGNHIIIKVADTGKGIPESILPRIFDPFFTTKEPGKGTGMGLSISYGIIEKHGGSITAESKVGQGTTFTIKLPVGNSPAGQVSMTEKKGYVTI